MPPNQPAHLTHAIPTNSHLSLTPNLSDLPDSQYTAALSGLKITYPSSPSTLPPSAPNDMESTDQHLIVGPTPTNPLLCITRVFFLLGLEDGETTCRGGGGRVKQSPVSRGKLGISRVAYPRNSPQSATVMDPFFVFIVGIAIDKIVGLLRMLGC
ncbi:hypothetical protein COCSADRAFT_31122 [Bipolaris sorokiniana ND90Pr]|uniref:Uncharacterized protein n=1 Tax=Cochliobolus sativus (strain ND90Pr / ATCC 201652) TaxID=665912 RepID=M2RV35_COCSN|nr:uncharacterized protein COCSADRAFT_31122 [Bipolaris sorokiniana ND90Pr]EMD58973.1 hypothetical protein COCSADRAFT_31122 [Bipolaris sorokiniana ND90Pr]